MNKVSTHVRIALKTKERLVRLRKFHKIKEGELIEYALIKAFKKR